MSNDEKRVIREAKIVDWGPEPNGMGEILAPLPNQPTEFVRCPCATAGCNTVGIGTTWADARKALWLDHARAAGHAIPDA